MKAGNIVIPVVPLEHLIEMKDESGRPQDNADAYYQKSKTGGMEFFHKTMPEKAKRIREQLKEGKL